MKSLLAFLAITMGAALAGSALAGGSLSDTSHAAWYASRAAGIVAYLCLWLGIVGGLLMSSAWFDGLIGRARLLAVHQSATLTGVGLGFLHALILIPDGYTDFGFRDVLVPFASYYEPLLTGLGALSLYLALIVALSFWFRGPIGPTTWRRIHYSGFVAWAGALWHGLALGTDSGEPWAQLLYLATASLVVFGLTIRLVYVKAARPRPAGGIPAA